MQGILNNPWSGKNYSDRVWSNTDYLAGQLNKIVNGGLLSGKDWRKMSGELQEQMNVGKFAAHRLIRTETAYMNEQASLLSMKDNGVEAVEILATLDKRTSDICQKAYGNKIPVDEIRIGVNHPPFHPYCRSTSVPVVDMEGLGTRIARDPETGKNYKVPSSMKYEDWKKRFVKPPAFALIRGREQIYSEEEINAMAGQLAQVVGTHIATESKWSGNIVLNAEEAEYGKLWNCDIATLPETAPDIILHEMLHACSVSYYNKAVYKKFMGIEEAAVQFMTAEIGEREKITIGGSEYDHLVEGLRTINRLIRFGSDYDFAKRLLEIPLPERLDWLENEIYGRLSDSKISVSDYQEIEEILEEIRTFKPYK